MDAAPAPRPVVRTTFEALWPQLRGLVLDAVDGRKLTGRPVLVGVDGRSGSGKTDLATCLVAGVRELGLTCTVLHLDDLYPGWCGLAAGLGRLCADVVAPLTGGADGVYTAWDWTASRPGPHRRVRARQVVVLEGVGVLASGCAGDLDLRVWLDAPAVIRRERALARDRDVFAPHWQEWAEQEDALFRDGPPPMADVVADTVTATVRWSTLGA